MNLDPADTPQNELTTLHAGQFLKLVQRGKWEFVERSNASAVVGIIAVHNKKLILTEQFRPPVNKLVIDIPAGLAGDLPGQEEELLEKAAARELEEETGYRAASWSYLFEIPTSPGLSSETVHLFEAHDLNSIGPGGGDEHEEISVIETELTELKFWLQQEQNQGKLIDPKVYLAMALFSV